MPLSTWKVAKIYKSLRRYWQDFIVALVLLTRLPLPRLPNEAFARSGSAVWAYPMVGALIAIVALLPANLCLWIGLPVPLAALVYLACTVLVSGGMHEDGLADCADGFWGGFEAARRMEIMRDSHIGTYGILALFIILSAQTALLNDLMTKDPAFWRVILIAEIMSRAAMACVIWMGPYARNDGLARALGTIPSIAAFGAGLAALLAGILLIGIVTTLILSALLALLSGLLLLLFRRKIGGITGDCLGAVQKLAMLTCLCVLSL